ncbi:hypothetical protein GW17_00047914 [Ensete ventricosum]|nr:hypothetical protein GW17_00047914 [Ensete ventricosum]
MSCNGCRILRRGCSDSCLLRPCLQWIDSAEAQAHATVFVAKFFGRAGLMSFISAVPSSQRPGSSPSTSLICTVSSLLSPEPSVLTRPNPFGRSSVPILALRGVRADHQPGERRRGPAVDRQLAPLPGGGGDRPPRRRAPPALEYRRRGPRRRRDAGGGRPPPSHEDGVLLLLFGQAAEGAGSI